MKYEAPAALDGQRLDRAIATLTGLPRAQVKNLLTNNGVSCDGEPTSTAAKRVVTGQLIEIDAAQLDAINAARARATELIPNPDVDFAVLHEDEHVIVVNKQPGLVTHPGAGHLDDTLLNGLLHRYPEITSAGPPERPGIVHRLDRDTSGLLVCARTDAAYQHLVAQLADHKVVREYVTFVRGTPAARRGTIDAAIGRSHRNRTKMQVGQDGREARTDYVVLGSAPCPELNPPVASLLTCRLQTGRTHQIRVHLASIKLPVLGDASYGCPDPFGANRQLLHAMRLTLEHPTTSETLTFVAEPPADIKSAAQALGLTKELAEALTGAANHTG